MYILGLQCSLGVPRNTSITYVTATSSDFDGRYKHNTRICFIRQSQVLLQLSIVGWFESCPLRFTESSSFIKRAHTSLTTRPIIHQSHPKKFYNQTTIFLPKLNISPKNIQYQEQNQPKKLMKNKNLIQLPRIKKNLTHLIQIINYKHKK